jgi:S-adenosylmethionine uptake transporter
MFTFSKQAQAIMWFVASLIISSVNDILMQKLGGNYSSSQVVFLRFLTSTIMLLPIVFYYGKSSIKSSHYGIHVLRGALLFVGIGLWGKSLQVIPVTTATIISFTIPVFVMILAAIFLKEKVDRNRIVPAILGFIGVTIVLNPTSINFHPAALLLLAAAVCFAMLDIINKKFVVEETTLAMMLYSNIVTTTLGIVPALLNWVTPSGHDILLFIILGCGANLILFCLLKAFARADASFLAPFRYLELLFSAGIAFLLFNYVPSLNTVIGALIVIPAMLALAYSKGSSKSPS